MKKLIHPALALTILCALATACAAHPQADFRTAFTAQEQADSSALLERGFPEDFLSALSAEEKSEYAADENIFYGGSKTFYYKFDDHEQPILVGTDSESGISPNGEIPGKDLTLKMSHSFQKSGDNISWIHVVFRYAWDTMPFWRAQDPIGISFHPDFVRIQNGSFSKFDKYTVSGYTGTKSQQSVAASYSAEGCGWYADLYERKDTTALFGQGSCKLEPIPGTTIKSGTGWTTCLYGKYVHVSGLVATDFPFAHHSGADGIHFGLTSGTQEMLVTYDITF